MPGFFGPLDLQYNPGYNPLPPYPSNRAKPASLSYHRVQGSPLPVATAAQYQAVARGPRPPTAGGLNTGCRGHTPALLQSSMPGGGPADPVASKLSSSATDALSTARLSTRSVYRPPLNFSPRNFRIEV